MTPTPRRKTYQKREIEGRKHISFGWAVSTPTPTDLKPKISPLTSFSPGQHQSEFFIRVFLSLSLSVSQQNSAKGEEAMHIFLESKSRERGEAVKAE